MVALGTTLINMKIKNLCKFGGWDRVEDAYTTGTDIFIGAGVTRLGETKPNIDLCGEDEVLYGLVLGYNRQLETIDSQGYYYRDYDNPFAASKWVLVGVPKPNGVYLILSDTNAWLTIGDKLKCVDGIFKQATTDDAYQFVAEEAVSGAAATRKYFYARYVKMV